MTIKQVINKIKTELRSFYTPNEIWVFIHQIFEKILNINRVTIHAHPEYELSEEQVLKINQIIKELKQFKPIQYIVGSVDFMGLTFKITPNVFIPRPETEELVKLVIDDFKNQQDIKILDIGTGSGVIAVSLAKFLPEAQVFATDLSSKALELAKINAKLFNVKVKFQKHDIIAPYPPVFDGQVHKFDVIVSNPPYVLESDKIKLSSTVVEYEPEDAIFVPDSVPLLFYEAICFFADKYLKPTGFIYCEINENLDKEIIRMLIARGYEKFSILQDFNGKSRVVKIWAKE